MIDHKNSNVQREKKILKPNKLNKKSMHFNLEEFFYGFENALTLFRKYLNKYIDDDSKFHRALTEFLPSFFNSLIHIIESTMHSV